MKRTLTAASTAALFLCQPITAMPGAAQTNDVAKRLERLEKIIQQQEEKLNRQRRTIVAQETRLKELEGRQRILGLTLNGETPRTVTILPEGREISWKELAKIRGGVKGTHARLVFPDGMTVTVPTARLGRLLAQIQPKEPTLPPPPPPAEKKEEEKPKAAPKPPARRPAPQPPRRTVQQQPPQQPPAKAPQPTTPTPTTTQDPAKKDDTTDPATRATGEKPTDQLLVEAGAVLLPAGRLQIEPSLDYSRFSGDRIAIFGLALFNAIVIGTIRVDDLQRDVLTAQLRGRYGITNRLQADITIPFVYRRDEELLGVATNNVFQHNTTGYGLGDIEAGLSYQPIVERGWIPGTLIRVFGRFPTGESAFDIPTEIVGPQGIDERLVRAPTGNGFFGAGATVTFVYSADPVAFFFGGGYTANLPNTFNRGGRINPGDSYNFFAGMNVALNERVSLNLSFINEKTLSSKSNGVKVPGSSFNDARVTLGASIGLNRRITMLFSASVGLTEQSPDFSFVIAVPITFDTGVAFSNLFRSRKANN